MLKRNYVFKVTIRYIIKVSYSIVILINPNGFSSGRKQVEEKIVMNTFFLRNLS